MKKKFNNLTKLASIKVLTYLLSMLYVLTAISSLQAATTNGGFETADFSGWSTVGATSIEPSEYGISPASGSYHALILSSDYELGTPDVSNLEEFLGMPSGSVNAIVGNGVEATIGSAIKQTVTVESGEKIKFSYNFLTNELTSSDYDYEESDYYYEDTYDYDTDYDYEDDYYSDMDDDYENTYGYDEDYYSDMDDDYDEYYYSDTDYDYEDMYGYEDDYYADTDYGYEDGDYYEDMYGYEDDYYADMDYYYGDELTDDFNFQDTAFYSIEGNGFYLADTVEPSFFTSITAFDQETGYLTVTTDPLPGGEFTVGFGVVNVGDDLVESALAIDDVSVVNGSPVPEPNTMMLLSLGMVGLVIGYRRRTKQNMIV